MFTAPHANSKRGRGLSREYKAWRDSAGLVLKSRWMAQGSPKLGHPLALTIRVNVDRRSDVTNRIKAIEDLLCKTLPGWPDDCWNDDVRVVRDREIDGALVTVTSLETAEAFA